MGLLLWHKPGFLAFVNPLLRFYEKCSAFTTTLPLLRLHVECKLHPIDTLGITARVDMNWLIWKLRLDMLMNVGFLASLMACYNLIDSLEFPCLLQKNGCGGRI